VAKTKACNTANETETTSSTTSVGDQEVTVCRRQSDRRDQPEATSDVAEAAQTEPTEPKDDDGPKPPERRKVQRRRQIDPTTCERDYTQDEIEFMHALDAYKRSSGRMFPTCSEILEVVRDIGYRKAEDFIEVEVEIDEAEDAGTVQDEATDVDESSLAETVGQ